MTALENAHLKVDELLEAAKRGMIVPVRLPGQIEEIAQLIQLAAQEQSQVTAAPAPDMEAFLKEEAYFVGHAVHELRTPMTSIRGYVDMLGAMGELNDMQKQFLGVIKTNIRRMEALLMDVSFINKIRKGTLKVAPKMDMFKNIAMKVEKEMLPVAQELGRTLGFDVPQGLPLLNLDGDHLALALNKLVENGLRYSPAGAGQVWVRASGDGSWLVILVEDNGIGMTEEEMSKLGTLYFRSDNDVVREHKGSGLGIPIAFGLIAALGGRVNVESAPGQGTRFTIYLPALS
ncbi:MAG: HAMP domain-containing histidine kinase [Anaerolineae bacterium]|nr:HAMP domain-containing histidine kinase [Anaerolineae bacterium]MDW8174018.1 HAMP domain-containing sensor histidine kinase [Anaerolineae bacterium]